MAHKGQEHSEWPDLAALFMQSAAGLTGAVRGILGPNADVEETLQEAFLKAWRSRGVVDPPRDPVGWLFVVTMNVARDARRRLIRRPPIQTIERADEMPDPSKESAPDRPMLTQESVDRAREAVHKLDEPIRDVFLLRVSGELSYEAIARSLDIPIGTAKTRMRHALADLRRTLFDRDGGEIHEA